MRFWQRHAFPGKERTERIPFSRSHDFSEFGGWEVNGINWRQEELWDSRRADYRFQLGIPKCRIRRRPVKDEQREDCGAYDHQTHRGLAHGLNDDRKAFCQPRSQVLCDLGHIGLYFQCPFIGQCLTLLFDRELI